LKTRQPLVSVIIPAWNGAAFIRETLQSILDQSYKNLEVILIDDASQDDTLSLVRTFRDRRLRVYRNTKNLGIAKTRNRGLEEAKGAYITFFDQDDIMLPEAIKKRVVTLEEDRHKNAVCGYTKVAPLGKRLFRGNALLKSRFEKRIGQRLTAQKKALPFLKMHPCMDRNFFFRFYCVFTLLTNLMMRKNLIKKVGRFTPKFKALDDVDFVCRLVEKTPIHFIDEPIKIYRVHDRNRSLCLSDKELNKDWSVIYKKYFLPSRLSF